MSISERSPNTGPEFEIPPQERALFDAIQHRFSQAVADGRADLIKTDSQGDTETQYLALLQPDEPDLYLFLGKSNVNTNVQSLHVESDLPVETAPGWYVNSLKQMKMYVLWKDGNDVEVSEYNEIDPENLEDSLPPDEDYYEGHQTVDDGDDENDPILHSRIKPNRQWYLLDMVERAQYPPEVLPVQNQSEQAA